MVEQATHCEGCGAFFGRFEAEAASTCAKCGRGPFCSKCNTKHGSCQKPLPETGFVCKLCGQNFAELGDFTKHAETCVRPPEIPGDVAFHCPKCGLSFVSSSEVLRHTQSCLGVPPAEMIAGYVKLSDLVFEHCHNNEARLIALGLLHESMQAAISSIVCADAWQTPKGD